ncbi:hypothetical protein F4806DRAFT_159830 [Annulohypoxylon nitens]|nr:hypothetical protein F4806DRAFT_159830 [Annulohypoxylon nitens]
MMPLNERLSPISTLARQCQVSFEHCLRDTLGFDLQRYSAIEDEMARFSIWSSNMSIFASWKDCLDYRVQGVPETQELILSILEILREQIEECICLSERLAEPPFPNEIQTSDLIQGDFERIFNSISSRIRLLHEISSTVRTATRKSPDVKAITSFQMNDDNGDNIEDIVRKYFTVKFRDDYPESSDIICDRLVTTMILRRKRVLYRRSRYTPNPTKSAQTSMESEIETPVVNTQKENEEQKVSNQDIEVAPEPSKGPLVVPSATTFASHISQRAPSAVPSVNSADSESHEELIFPPRPVPNHGLTEVTCPYCLDTLSNLEMSNDEEWRSHILEDLDSFVCLFDHCDEPNVLYRHSEEWLLHMRKHVRRWRCSTKFHGVIDFNSRHEYEIHVKQSHKKIYSSTQLDILAERSMHSSGPLLDTCPLCGTKVDLINDMIHHLRSLALESLYSEYDDPNYSFGSYNDQSIKSRSIVNNLLDQSRISLNLSPPPRPSPRPPGNNAPLFSYQNAFPASGLPALNYNGLDNRQENSQDFIEEHTALSKQPAFLPVYSLPQDSTENSKDVYRHKQPVPHYERRIYCPFDGCTKSHNDEENFARHARNIHLATQSQIDEVLKRIQ